jgi:hypothetical protein
MRGQRNILTLTRQKYAGSKIKSADAGRGVLISLRQFRQMPFRPPPRAATKGIRRESTPESTMRRNPRCSA